MRWSPTLLLSLVALVVGGLVVADLRSPSAATDVPTPVEAGQAVGGAWYCAAGAVGEGNELHVLTAVPPGPDTPSDTEIRALHGTTTRVATQPVFPGSARLTDLGIDEVQGDAVGSAVRWWDQPTATSRVWHVDEGQGGAGSGIVSGPCASAPSPTWYVPGLSTAGGGTARLYLVNPFGSDASVSISFTTPTGPEQPILLENVSIPQGSVEVVELNEFIPRQADIGVVVETRSGRVVVEGVQQLDAAIGGVDAVALVRAAPQLAETWTIPWSLTDPETDLGELDDADVVDPDETDDVADEEETPAVTDETAPPVTDEPPDETAPPATDEPGQPAAVPTDEPTVDVTDEATATVTEDPTDPDATSDPTDDPIEPTEDVTDPAPVREERIVATESPGGGTASWIWVSNPGDEPAAVTVTLHTASGAVVPDIGDELLIDAGHILRVDLRGLLPEGESSAGATVRSENGIPVVAGMSTLLQPESDDPDVTGYTSQLGWPSPDPSWVVGGEQMAGRTQVLHVTNPGAETAVVDVALWDGAALRRPGDLQGLEVDAGALVELDVTDDLDGAEQSVAFVSATEGSVVAGRHSVGADVADWVAHTGVPASLWSGGDVVPPVDHAPQLLEGLGTSGGLQTRGPEAVEESSPLPTEPTPTVTGE